jgi:hypothetical protein
MLAALVDLSPDGTDPSLMALHYKAKSYVSVENGVVALSAHLSLGRS